MSVQTDCEMLSVEAMEAYARKYNLSGNEVAKLFHKNQVFENMLIQHEYLHQVSFEEIMEFVENVIADDSRELVVYHGSCFNLIVVILVKDFIQQYYERNLRNGHIDYLYEKRRKNIMFMNFYLKKYPH